MVVSKSPWGLDELLEPLRARPDRAGVLTDFDGTLSGIVDDPGSARLFEGAFEVLDDLAGRYRLVGVVSGRPVEFLTTCLPESVQLFGLYGLESRRDGERADHPSAGTWREVIADVAATSKANGPDGMQIENKGLSLTFHFRTRPEVADDVRDWADRQASRSGLLCRAARKSVELHPPISSDKGTTVHDLAEGLSAVCFLGDDHGDLAAFDALDDLARDGVTTVRVAVESDEAPPELVERADAVVDGPAGALDLLRRL
ncbi:trehalose-phosphatase [soil metagenome]